MLFLAAFGLLVAFLLHPMLRLLTFALFFSWPVSIAKIRMTFTLFIVRVIFCYILPGAEIIMMNIGIMDSNIVCFGKIPFRSQPSLYFVQFQCYMIMLRARSVILQTTAPLDNFTTTLCKAFHYCFSEICSIRHLVHISLTVCHKINTSRC